MLIAKIFFAIVIEVNYLAQKIRPRIVCNCRHVFVEAMTIPIRRIGIDECMAWIDARVLYEDFAHGIIIDVEVFCNSEKLDAKRHLRRQKTVFHILCQLRHGCINHEKSVPCVVAHLQHRLYLVAPFSPTAQHGKIKIEIIAMLSVAVIFGAVNNRHGGKTVVKS